MNVICKKLVGQQTKRMESPYRCTIACDPLPLIGHGVFYKTSTDTGVEETTTVTHIGSESRISWVKSKSGTNKGDL